MAKVTKQSYLDTVAQKLQGSKKFLQFGTMIDKQGNGIGQPLRDEIGVQTTFSNVLNIADNFYSLRNGFDAVANYTEAAATNFSGGESYGNISLVQTMGAVDVTLLLLAKSLIPYLAVDRSMANPIDTVYYANLIAENTAGGVNAGDTVLGNFQPPNTNVNVGPAIATQTVTISGGATTYTFNVNQYLVPGNINISLLRSGTTYTISDMKKDGVLYCNGLAIPGTVNYTTGAIVLTSGLANGDAILVTALQDVTADATGSGIIKVRAAHTALQLTSLPKQFIFDENEATNMYMNKIMNVASRASGIVDYRTLHFGRMTNLYIENVNRDLINILVKIGAQVTPITLTLAGYGAAGSFAQTKNDVVSKFFIDCANDLLSRTGVAATVCVTGTQGSSILKSVKDSFVPAADFFTVLNGFVGTFDGMPVYRHNLLDSLQSAGTADFYFGAKLPDNTSGTMIYGEYIPLVQTPTVGNVQNPLQKSTGWFSQVGSTAINGALVSHGVITLGTY